MKKTLAEHLREASELFGSGEALKAGQIWRAILKKDPSNDEAKAGLLKVRDALSADAGTATPAPEPSLKATPGPAPEQSAAAPAPIKPPSTPVTANEDIELCLREGCSLYDAGARCEALSAWEKVLAIDPGHSQALSFVRGVRKELGLAMPDSAQPAPKAPPRPQLSKAQQEEAKAFIERGVQLYENGLFKDALGAWESALALDSANNLVKGYIGMVQKDMEALSAAAPKSSPDEAIQAPTEPEPIEPDSRHPGVQAAPSAKVAQVPSFITQRAETRRQGPELPKEIVNVPMPSWFAKPLFLKITILVALLLAVGTVWIRTVRKDSLLRATQEAIRDEAIKSVRQSNRIENLTPTPTELKSQAQRAMNGNPLMAYLLAQEIINRDPSDTTAARLLDQANHAMAVSPLPRVSGGDFSRLMAAGNLEDAGTLMEARLRQSPNDMKARENLARVSLLMARTLLEHEKWDSARSHLLMGAALFPNDPTWQARLKLLERLRSVPKDEQRRWIELLG